MDKSAYEPYEEKMKKTLAALSAQFATVRAGRANVAVLDQVRVDYYGTPTPISQIATVSTPDPRTLVISPWDASTLKPLEKAIQTSEIGINPANDGKVLRLVFPQLTEDRRRELTKTVAKYAEDGKVAVRNIRRDAVEAFKAQKKKSELTEDDLKDAEKDLQKLTDEYTKEIEKLQDKKDKELLEI
ncbi:MAG: ribosome recycling factor [Oscillospiraceae bacterium]|jgi:ribosome recycling factor|nr:ribosome recycling factor [Oscillospiraceae bacterium]